MAAFNIKSVSVIRGKKELEYELRGPVETSNHFEGLKIEEQSSSSSSSSQSAPSDKPQTASESDDSIAEWETVKRKPERKRQQPHEAQTRQTKTLYVKNLAYSMTNESLRLASGGAGARIITCTESGRSKGFGFVDFNTPEDCNSALQTMQGKIIQGRPVMVDFAVPKEQARPNQGDNRSGGNGRARGGYGRDRRGCVPRGRGGYGRGRGEPGN